MHNDGVLTQQVVASCSACVLMVVQFLAGSEEHMFERAYCGQTRRRFLLAGKAVTEPRWTP